MKLDRVRVMVLTGIVGASGIAGCSSVHTDLYLFPENPASTGLLSGLSRPDASRIARGQLAVEYSPDIDRITFLGVRNGPNLVHTVNLDRDPADDGSYTFYGGGYTWVAPQGGELGWRNEDGELQNWPPDPAMDSGPSSVVGRSMHRLLMENPRSRDGLVQRKTIELTAVHELTLTYELVNESEDTVRRAHWINTAASPDSIIALRLREGESAAQLYATEEGHAERLGSLLSAVDDNGWALLKLSDLHFEGGIKVYTDGPAEIAIWVPNPDWLRTRGFWLHRALAEPMEVEQRNELRTLGEGPVAVYLNPGLELFEAELYGPVVDIDGGDSAALTEIWTVYVAPTPLTRFMSEEHRLPAQPKGFFESR